MMTILLNVHLNGACTLPKLGSHFKKEEARRKRMAGMVIDVKCAFLYGKAKRNVYIWLPDEDAKGREGYMGKLDKAMYGTRDAAQNWGSGVHPDSTRRGI